MSEDEKKLDRIQEDLKRGIKYIEDANVDTWIRDYKFRKAFGGDRPVFGRATTDEDGNENLWAWWDRHFPSTM